ncbi:hypothetical protein OCK02_17080 [Rhizobium sp. TRM96647]|uniref:hypothetical protein n=1 Tax=unclassified Rhizobium TaxID=2613769 RepID=UPI0021E77D98|nr:MULTISPECIES: hypothetical protein [unclassified Rhizobium]MCV3737919.1 hypothetical protein [Rhizobium sp. TRM96647]MCV3759351.1 hypothetical protein [Rhizobium sp. TRM96650]
MRLLSCMLLGAAVLTLPAWAAAGPPDARCTCRNRDGSKHALGAVVCLSVDGRKYLARCEMVLNVTSWQKVQDGCPVAARIGPIPSTPYDVQ